MSGLHNLPAAASIYRGGPVISNAQISIRAAKFHISPESATRHSTVAT
ncbi:MAG: hypothetical protein JWR09_872 [Mucilaginibacter sp.]|nr:hypothetical protein [Mucilaginibacter sp.]